VETSRAELERIACRVKWGQPAADTLSHPDDFFCRVMALGWWDDVVDATKVFGVEGFRHALAGCPPGIVDPASWNFWHLKLGSAAVPPLPQRTFA
jgi:hypothetical protein